jgi:large subunit ribosomal protein L24
MKKKFSKNWKSSKKPKKQRKYRKNAPLHIQKNFFKANLSKELRTKYGRRNLTIKKGDSVKILRGQFKKKTGKINKILRKANKVYVEGIENIRKDGTKSFYPIHPSNLMITELLLDDKKRKKVIERTKPKEIKK